MEYFSVSVGREASHHQLRDFEPRQRGVPQSQVLPAFNIKYLDSVVSLNLKLVSKVFSAAISPLCKLYRYIKWMQTYL